jgi:hypothetical protein
MDFVWYFPDVVRPPALPRPERCHQAGEERLAASYPPQGPGRSLRHLTPRTGPGTVRSTRGFSGTPGTRRKRDRRADCVSTCSWRDRLVDLTFVANPSAPPLGSEELSERRRSHRPAPAFQRAIAPRRFGTRSGRSIVCLPLRQACTRSGRPPRARTAQTHSGSGSIFMPGGGSADRKQSSRRWRREDRIPYPLYGRDDIRPR